MSEFKSIYDILSFTSVNEADGDDKESLDDDFSIDTSLDDDGGSNDNGGSPDAGGGSDDGVEMMDDSGDEGGEGGSPDSGGDDASAGGGTDESPDEEVKANTDIFSSLTAEEQQVKIKELKKLYSSLYSSCDEILERLNKLDINEENLETISRVSTSIHDTKIYISDYLANVFPTKSYIENDVTFIRFLSVIKSITEILDDIGKKYNKEQEKKDKDNKKE